MSQNDIWEFATETEEPTTGVGAKSIKKKKKKRQVSHRIRIAMENILQTDFSRPVQYKTVVLGRKLRAQAWGHVDLGSNSDPLLSICRQIITPPWSSVSPFVTGALESLLFQSSHEDQCDALYKGRAQPSAYTKE